MPATSRAEPDTIYLKDYQPTPYVLEQIALDFDLQPVATTVVSRQIFAPRTDNDVGAALLLNGEKIELISVVLDGKPLSPPAYVCDDKILRIAQPPHRRFELTITTRCAPGHNTALTGLYQSQGVYCTQCEAEGFRRITYSYDRPDVMAVYQVRIVADKALCPVLLSNGNFVKSGALDNGRHFAVWHDPHPKPSYLFALVAGDLAEVSEAFVTASGAKVKLGIYVEKGKEDRCAWAMQSLKESMRWDEQRFGREYDLDIFNIVAVSDFNMGAMENKGLNIFNDKYILARPETATDTDYQLIEAIIAHEYFHNWTGNRITCRDWFQLCLKEGLTVFRDQEFSSDLRSRPVKRISDVKTLRARQFPEDAGPLAHPVRPFSYIEINNFYTPTVYEKGAEICRMLLTLLGRDDFAKAMDLYFARFDGTAATVEDFISCMAEASGRDLAQFFRWYEQPGTPRLTVTTAYDSTQACFDVTISQSRKGESGDVPLHIPLVLGLIDPAGQDMPVDVQGAGPLAKPLIELTEAQQSFRFVNITAPPVLSLNRGFSAPVILDYAQSPRDLLFLMGHDCDAYNRWQATQILGRSLIVDTLLQLQVKACLPDCVAFAEALRQTLDAHQLDDAFKALMLGLPTEAEIAAHLGHDVNTDMVLQARNHVRHALGHELASHLTHLWQATAETAVYAPTPEQTGKRALRQAVLNLLSAAQPDVALELMQNELSSAETMSVEFGTLAAMVNVDHPALHCALQDFYQRHHSDHLLVDKWFGLNALIPGPQAAEHIAKLKNHPDFRLTTPNRVYALIGGFTSGNLAGFHAADGAGYRVVADTILELDALNPQVAARIATGFRSWQIMNEVRRTAARNEMERILRQPGLSADCFEILSKTLRG